MHVNAQLQTIQDGTFVHGFALFYLMPCASEYFSHYEIQIDQGTLIWPHPQSHTGGKLEDYMFTWLVFMFVWLKSLLVQNVLSFLSTILNFDIRSYVVFISYSLHFVRLMTFVPCF